jgi:hypothetical protein
MQDATHALGLAPVADEGAMMPSSATTPGMLRINAAESWDIRLTRQEVADLLLWFPIPSVYSAAEQLVTEYLAGGHLLLRFELLASNTNGPNHHACSFLGNYYHSLA